MKVSLHPSLIVLVWHGVCAVVSLMAGFGWVKDDEDVSSTSKIAYQTLAITYVTIYVVAAGPVLVKATFFSVTPQETSRLQFQAGCSLWVLGDLPLFIADFIIYDDHGFVSVLQGIEFILRVTSFLFGFVLLWISGLRIAIAWLHRRDTCDLDLIQWSRRRTDHQRSE